MKICITRLLLQKRSHGSPIRIRVLLRRPIGVWRSIGVCCSIGTERLFHFIGVRYSIDTGSL